MLDPNTINELELCGCTQVGANVTAIYDAKDGNPHFYTLYARLDTGEVRAIHDWPDTAQNLQAIRDEAKIIARMMEKELIDLTFERKLNLTKREFKLVYSHLRQVQHLDHDETKLAEELNKIPRDTLCMMEAISEEDYVAIGMILSDRNKLHSRWLLTIADKKTRQIFDTYPCGIEAAHKVISTATGANMTVDILQKAKAYALRNQTVAIPLKQGKMLEVIPLTEYQWIRYERAAAKRELKNRTKTTTIH
jgi:hypothetical protein